MTDRRIKDWADTSKSHAPGFNKDMRKDAAVSLVKATAARSRPRVSRNAGNAPSLQPLLLSILPLVHEPGGEWVHVTDRSFSITFDVKCKLQIPFSTFVPENSSKQVAEDSPANPKAHEWVGRDHMCARAKVKSGPREKELRLRYHVVNTVKEKTCSIPTHAGKAKMLHGIF